MYLADQYKAPPAIAPSPSVAGFKEWLERQPREGTFDYLNCIGCATDQYLNSTGTSWLDFCTDDALLLSWLNNFAAQAFLKANHERRLPTFGDVLAEIEKAGL